MAAMVRARIHPCGGIIRNYSSIHSSAIRLFSHPVSVVPPVKILETFSEEFEVGSHKIKLETGLLARFANGAVVYNTGDTHVLSTVASGKGDNGSVRDFLPLTVSILLLISEILGFLGLVWILIKMIFFLCL